jgi:hypothetical protein
MMALQASGVSGLPEPAPCWTIGSTVRWLMALTVTVAAVGLVAAAAAGLASLPGLQAPWASSDAALAGRVLVQWNLITCRPCGLIDCHGRRAGGPIGSPACHTDRAS